MGKEEVKFYYLKVMKKYLIILAASGLKTGCI
jgi:hypothetical protein